MFKIQGRGTLKKCVNDQAVYPLSEHDGLGGPREEIHRPWRMETLRTDLRVNGCQRRWQAGDRRHGGGHQ